MLNYFNLRAELTHKHSYTLRKKGTLWQRSHLRRIPLADSVGGRIFSRKKMKHTNFHYAGHTRSGRNFLRRVAETRAEKNETCFIFSRRGIIPRACSILSHTIYAPFAVGRKFSNLPIFGYAIDKWSMWIEWTCFWGFVKGSGLNNFKVTKCITGQKHILIGLESRRRQENDPVWLWGKT